LTQELWLVAATQHHNIILHTASPEKDQNSKCDVQFLDCVSHHHIVEKPQVRDHLY
jgi:hypothetical protein